jgi:pyruvate,water dikinase
MLEAVNACLESVNAPRAIAYRRVIGLKMDNVMTGILVQEMIQPIVSGVAFTMNPVTGATDELVINASWGLGEALVSGRVEPDEFHVRKSDGTVLSSSIGSKRFFVASKNGVSTLVETEEQKQEAFTLSNKQLQELTDLLTRIEQEYGSPQDIEWCHDGDQFWILQSRVVTKKTQLPLADIQWTRANVREILPDLTSPQALQTISETLEQAERIFYKGLVAPETELGPVAKGFYGRLYFNLSQLLHVAKQIGQPPAALLRMLGHEGEIQEEDEIRTERPFQEVLRVLPANLRILWRIMTVGSIMRKQIILIDEFVNHFASCDPRTLSDTEVWDSIKTGTAKLPEFTWKTFPVLAGLSFYRDMVKSLCEKVGFPSEHFLDTQLAVGEHSVSAQQGLDLLNLANHAREEQLVYVYFLTAYDNFDDYREALSDTNFLKRFENFLQTYGHRSDYESDWSLPRYYEDPSSLLYVIRAHVQAPNNLTIEEIRERQEYEATETWREFVEKLTWFQIRTILPRVRYALKRAKQLRLWRESNRSDLMRCISELRRWNLELADRFAKRGWIEETGDYFFLKLEEVEKAVDENKLGNLKSIITKRKEDYNSWQHLEMPMLMKESELPALIRGATSTMHVSSDIKLHGLNISPGFVEGEVVVINDPAEFSRMKQGTILVAPATNPTWTPIFTLAIGIIVEIGGTLSHSSIVAREYGLPALANVKDATKLLRDGDRVRLDAMNETVEVLSKKPEKIIGT